MGIVKEIKRTANVAWSPREMQSILLAGGTVAQQLDATFSSSANIEIYSLDLTSSRKTMECVGRIESKNRFHKLNWSGLGLADGSHPQGVLIGGSDNGTISFWDVASILESKSDEALMCQMNQHVGAVRTLDVNPFQPNLLASGASESEIYIWDLNNPTSPMSPGNKLHPLEDVTCVAWNRQAQHILGSTSPSGRSVVWDLRKNEPIIQVSDSNARVHCKAISWHPDIPTQLVTGSEDDRSPVIQLWDLRFATSPTRVLEGHKRGVLSLSWCQQDADLLLSASKDNQVLCWNPNSNVENGEVVYQLPATNQWIFDCSWCPRNPDIICTTSFDGHVTLYSLLGGGSTPDNDPSSGPNTPTQVDPNDPFAAIANTQKKVTRVEEKPLKTPPKWFRRPCAAGFGFGGRLVSFSSVDRSVAINQVVTEPHLLKQSNEFETIVKSKSYIEHCDMKAETVGSQREQKIWNFLRATFDPDPRKQYLQLLGYDTEELEKQFSVLPESSQTNEFSLDALQEKLAVLPLEEGEGEEKGEGPEEQGEEGGENLSSTAGIFGSEASRNSGSVFDGMGDLSTQPSRTGTSISLVTGDDPDGMLTKALLVGNFTAAVNICMNTDRTSEALILSVAGGSDLYESTKKRFFSQKDGPISKLISLVTNHDWSNIVANGNLDNWQEILASLVTYASPDEFTTCCDDLGRRLEDDSCIDEALLCYICSGNIEKFIDCWLLSLNTQGMDPLLLHDLIEKVVLLRHAIHRKTRRDPTPLTNTVLGNRIRLYADILAAQGSLKVALSYLDLTSTSSQSNCAVLRDRLYHSIGTPGSAHNPPPFPFERVNVGTYVPPQTVTPTNHHPNGPSHLGGEASTNPYHRHGNMYPGVGGAGGYKGQVPTVPGGHTNSYTGSAYIPGNMRRTHGPPGGNVPLMQPVEPQPRPPTMTPYVPMVTHPSSSALPPTMYTPSVSSYNVPTTSYQQPMKDVPVGPPPSTGLGGAWNDPPMLKKQKQPTTYNAPLPLTVPLAPPTETVQPLTRPLTEGAPPTQVKPGTPVEKMASHTPSPSIEKKPIPTEHVVIPGVLEGILTQCRTRATNAAMRRKTDEIGRKLEILSDLLRESRLSMDILQGLHYIIQDCQSMNYQSALARLNQMVASSNLSEISSFFPGIKTLIQLAIQLRI